MNPQPPRDIKESRDDFTERLRVTLNELVESWNAEHPDREAMLRSTEKGWPEPMSDEAHEVMIERVKELNKPTWSQKEVKKELGKWRKISDKVYADRDNYTHSVDNMTKSEWEQAKEDMPELQEPPKQETNEQ